MARVRRPVRSARCGGDGAADADEPRHAIVRALRRRIPHDRVARRGIRWRRDPRVGRHGLQPARRPPPPRRAHRSSTDGWPHDAASLAQIDGIGPFTAAIIASFAFSQPAACVDTNVRRVLGRLAGDETIDGKRLQSLADGMLAVREPARWNQAVMDYGARVCTVRPKCGECVDRALVPVAHGIGPQRTDDRAPAPLLRVADEPATYTRARRNRSASRSSRAPRAGGAAASSTPCVLCRRARRITMTALRAALSDAGTPPPPDELKVLVSALESARPGRYEAQAHRAARLGTDSCLQRPPRGLKSALR